MIFNLNEFLMSISYALDFVEIDLLGVRSNHSKRVAYIALKMAQILGLTEEEKHDIVALAILHDNGTSDKSVHDRLSDKSLDNIGLWETKKDHCIIGEENIKTYPFLTDVSNIITYHHENYDGSGFFGLKGDEIPLMSHIIKLADTLEVNFNLENSNANTAKEAIDFLKGLENTSFSPMILDTFQKISFNKSFWLDMRNDFINSTLKRIIPRHSIEMDFSKIRKITQVLSKIIDSKSKFTDIHSKGLSELVAKMSDFYLIDSETKMKLIIAADMHDIGKLAVPNSIIDKPGKLTYEEFEVIKEHPYYTRITLEQIQGFEDITEWASNHHEKLNCKGYPYGLTEKDLDFNSRLMACLDIYQALTEERPYRQPLSHNEAMRIMKTMVDDGSIDGKIVNDIGSVIK